MSASQFGRAMIYPYTIFGRLGRFNYRFQWHNDRFLRFRTYLYPLHLYLFYKIQRAAIGDDERKQMWRDLRAHRRHGWFDPVKEDSPDKKH